MDERRLPRHGEVWLKKPHPGICRVGWSIGAGVAVINLNVNYAWGTMQQIECGCLVKLAESLEEYDRNGMRYTHGEPMEARGGGDG